MGRKAAPLIWTLYYRRNFEMFRVWRDGWPDDMFEVLTSEQFHRVQYVAARFGIVMIDQDAIDAKTGHA